MLECGLKEVELIEQSLIDPSSEAPQRVVSSDDKLFTVSVNGRVVGRIVNNAFVWTPLGLQYSEEHRALANMVIQS